MVQKFLKSFFNPSQSGCVGNLSCNPTSSLLNNLMLVLRFLNSGVLLRLELAVRLLYLQCEAEIKTSSCSGRQVS